MVHTPPKFLPPPKENAKVACVLYYIFIIDIKKVQVVKDPIFHVLVKLKLRNLIKCFSQKRRIIHFIVCCTSSVSASTFSHFRLRCGAYSSSSV